MTRAVGYAREVWALRTRVATLERALKNAEPWSHVVAGPPEIAPGTDATRTVGLASMAPGARGFDIAHWSNCPGCAARAALSTAVPA